MVILPQYLTVFFFNDTSAVNNYKVEGINHERISMTMNYMLSIEKNIIIANGK